MNKEEFVKELEMLDIKLDNDKLDKLDKYKNFLIEYNKHTNLTAITNEEDIYLKHFYDSLTITKAIDLDKVNTLIDIGSGAGFPGMVLKIVYPNLDVTLVDSNNKKTKFLIELANLLNINVSIINDRVENIREKYLNYFDVVTSRAVANLRVLSELSIPLVKENGLFIPLKGNIDDNLEDSINTIKILDSEVLERLEFNLYNDTNKRNIIVIKKIKKTGSNILRAYDKIIKKPLQK